MTIQQKARNPVRKLLLAIAGAALAAAMLWWWLSPPPYADVSRIGDGRRTPGDIIAIEHIGGHNRLVWQALLWWADLPAPTPVVDGAEMFRIRYWSELAGQPVEASGLMSVPYAVLGGATPRGTVMYLHGTSPDRSASPSSPGAQEGLLPAAVFAGGGYILLAPDYFGLGQSRAGQAYVHARTTASAARDLITAAQVATSAMQLRFSPDLHLVGFSQGGFSVAVVQRALEAAPIAGVRIKAAAAIAGAFDLLGISVPYALANKHSLYLSYLAHSYAVQYRQPLGSLFVPRHAALVPGLFDGNHSVDAVAAALPADPADLFRPEILAQIKARQPNWFTMALAENQAWQWRPAAPLRLYYGDRDLDVSPQDSRHFHAQARRLGGNISLVPLGPHDHGESVLQAVPQVRRWFDALSGPESAQ